MDKRKGQEGNSAIIWHPAFVEAIKLELDDYSDVLEFHSEYQLTSEPLRIDCVIIKKAKDVVIRKNIAAIFREVNLLEYKSPDDYVSVVDFYKVYSYACLFIALENVPVANLTITFVVNRFPRTLIAHLQEVRKFSVEEIRAGIYTVKGDIFPIQVVNSRRLSADENLWLKDLCGKLSQQEIQRVITEISRQEKRLGTGAYLDVITRANNDNFRRTISMRHRQTTLSFDELLEEAGWTARWEARGKAIGEENKAMEVAQNMIKIGLPFEIIVSVTSLEPEKVKMLYRD